MFLFVGVRYIKTSSRGFFYEICDTEQPARDENYTDEASATRVRNAVQDWRERLNAKEPEGISH